MTEITPEVEAAVLAAIETLVASGARPTARSVQQLAGVNMKDANDVLGAWKETQANAVKPPPMPDLLRARLDSIWTETYALAITAFDTERVGLNEQLKAALSEVEALTEDVTEVSNDLEAARARIEELEAERAAVTAASVAESTATAAAHASALAELQSRADRAEGSNDSLTAERDRVLAERDAAVAALASARQPE